MSRQYLHRACKKGAPKLEKRDSVNLSKTFNSSFDEVDENIAPMSQFDLIVKNIALENEKCNYEPEYDRNWSDLKYFMQRECIKHMDVKTKIRLSQASKYEKSRFSKENLKLEYIVERIALESEKCNYNPEIDMNWCELPMEMRNECVKRMDFKTRCRFRRIARQFDYATSNYNVVAGTKRRLEIETIPREDPDYGCISAILKHAEVEEFGLLGEDQCESHVEQVFETIAKLGPFQFESLWFEHNPYIDFFMKLCENLVKVDFHGYWFRWPYKEVLELQSTMKVKEFRFAHVKLDFPEFLIGLVQKWIDNDVETGKSVQFHTATLRFVDEFAEKFADRIIEKTAKIVRIRMNNDKTQIMMRLIGYYKKKNDYEIEEYCSCKIIPIDLPKSEYGIGDEWIQAVFENEGKPENAEDQENWGPHWP